MATLWIRNKPDIYKAGRVCKLRWSIIQVDKDRRRYGLKEGHYGRDCLNNGRDNYIFYRVHVPGLSPLMKSHIEWANESEVRQWGEEVPTPERLHPRRYYLDFDALPEWAQISLRCEGDVTLPPHIAYQCIKRWSDGECDPDILTHFKAT